MPRKGKTSDLGRALARRRERDAEAAKGHAKTAAGQLAAATGRHTVDFTTETRLQSILDATDLEELMLNAAHANEDFSAERYPRPLASHTVVVTPLNTRPGKQEVAARRELDRTTLRIPRRPKWDVSTTYEQLMKNEMEMFLTWRRTIASVEENHSLASTIGGPMMTPFEKNLEVWRQLWRVVERSDVVVQIVDARNPLLYYCEDLRRYVSEEMGRSHVLLLNKSDLLSSTMIERWRRYFEKRNVDAIFFSAFSSSVDEELHDKNIIGVHELVEKLSRYERRAPQTQTNQRLVVGMCGYPNVGKSSTINVLLERMAHDTELALADKEGEASKDHDASEEDSSGSSAQTEKSTAANSERSASQSADPRHHKRVAVSSTPGKTKHFQTLVLTDKLLLCDCPGLVFPSFSSSKAELICAGVLSIDTMRGDHVSPVSLLARRIPAATLEGVYGIRFAKGKQGMYNEEEEQGIRDGYVSGEKLLDTHARARGFMSDHDKPDQSRSARVLLKDYVNGRIIYVHGPPGEEGESGIGPDVFAKKGKLVYARAEARKLKLATREKRTHEKDYDVDFGADKGKTAVKARVSGRNKRTPAQEFVRVERSFMKTG
ncbi:unnamed protein product [Agarophyton chilense]